MYKKASIKKLRFTTTKGNLSVEQLWGLTMTELKTLIKSLYKLIKKEADDDLAFLEEDKVSYSDDQLRYDIAVDVYKTKQTELQQKHEDAEKKARNQHIAEIIARKQDEALESKSIEELQAMLKD